MSLSSHVRGTIVHSLQRSPLTAAAEFTGRAASLVDTLKHASIGTQTTVRSPTPSATPTRTIAIIAHTLPHTRIVPSVRPAASAVYARLRSQHQLSRRSFTTSNSSSPSHPTPLSLYEATIASGQLRPDARQRATVMLLEQTFQELVAAKASGGRRRPVHATPTPSTPAPASSSSGGGFFGFAKSLLKKAPSSSSAASSSSSSQASTSPFHGIQGLYLHGGVGSGKTMLMNQFFDCLTPELVSGKVVRKHFHSFMLDIHRRLHELRKSNPNITDPISIVASEFVSRECEVLALDEFQVTDVADAMILKQLFGRMWQDGCVMVATSNRPPEELYKNGLNRSVFLPFIDDLKSHCKIHAMEEGQDHRLLGTIAEGVYHTPVNARTHESMLRTFDRLAGSTDPTRRGPAKITVMMGRTMHVPMASMNENVAMFSFAQLCESNVGAADYISLVSTYKYILLTDIPILYFHQREKIRRFITFLDVAYEHHTRLVLQAEEGPLKLFQAPTSEMTAGVASAPAAPEFEGAAASAPKTNGSANATSPLSSTTPVGVTSAATTAGAKYDEQFASSRAISRLIEMSSNEYLKACARARDQENAPQVELNLELSQKHLAQEASERRQAKAAQL